MSGAACGPPPAEVLDAFGAAGEPVPLPGGRGRSWRAGGVVLKPVDTSLDDLRWQEALFAPSRARRDVRLAAPLRSSGGDLVVDGWTARPHLPGTTAGAPWTAVVAAGRRFCAAVRREPRPPHLDRRDDPWARADRVAWEEDDPPAALSDLAALNTLAALRRPVPLPAQLVHGDLTGNVLVHPGLPPAVIDVSPYWRPVEWGTAVVVADALVHHGAGPGLVARLLPGPDGGQLLVRALLFRGATEVLAAGGPATPTGPASAWARAVRTAAAAVSGAAARPPAPAPAGPGRCRPRR
ncbi:MAG: hypothetical protein AVDCRST_MAG35-400 [uncultured Quadrisphaera sp.]|uniref:Aminoglycoside phosphotransferase domain-containing protein n=1 Tax=uncultured Quadrisphaera sp. TaxID=904978 RepID=A0A6J4NPG8_9ACTN|nr:MAG: hypothetical protein AVDCRST_MAG35-400 [uncultured Quadrisphaera sp.]